MPQERHNPFPFPIASEVEAAPGTREEKAARNVIVRHIQGIPRRAYLLGESDHAPVLAGIRDLTAAAYAVLDAIPQDQLNGTLGETATHLRNVLEDHGCPETREHPEL
jgi:hypothetical protein